MIEYLEFYKKDEDKLLFRIDLDSMEKYIAKGFYNILKEYGSVQKDSKNFLTKEFLLEMLWFIGDEVDRLSMEIIQGTQEMEVRDFCIELNKYSCWHDSLLEISKENIEEIESTYFIVKGYKNE